MKTPTTRPIPAAAPKGTLALGTRIVYLGGSKAKRVKKGEVGVITAHHLNKIKTDAIRYGLSFTSGTATIMSWKFVKKVAHRNVLDVLGDPANEAAINGILAQNQKRFNEARAYLKRIDTTPDADLTHEERFIKRMGERS